MSLPQIAPFPPASFRRDMVPDEWEACLDAWISLVEAHLRLPDSKFFSSVVIGSSLVPFLTSFFSEVSVSSTNVQSSKDIALRRVAFLLAHRLLSHSEPPHELLQWQFLGHMSQSMLKSGALARLLRSLWTRMQVSLQADLEKLRSRLSTDLESALNGKLKTEEVLIQELIALASLCHVVPEVGQIIMTGSDFLDAAASGYVKYSHDLQAAVLALVYVALISLAQGDKPNFSLLFDNIYTLKSIADRSKGSPKPPLLSDLVTKTSVLSKLKAIPGNYSARVKTLVSSLTAYQRLDYNKPKKQLRRKDDKGKGRAPVGSTGEPLSSDAHAHQLSLISQIQELFPDLGAGFIVKLLDEYGDNAEQVTAHLLDDSLPEHLKLLDRHADLELAAYQESSSFAPDTELQLHNQPPSSHHLSQRRNVFDNDEFDQLTVNASRLHIGRKNATLTADTILSDHNDKPEKAAIFAALAAFDADDDERDDTYDADDVGGTVDTATGADDDEFDASAGGMNDAADEALFRAWKANSALFQRDAATRRAPAREALRKETNLTDEAIEGWAVMLRRNPRRLKRLEDRFASFDGSQLELTSTAYRANGDSDDDGEASGSRGRGGFRGGRGRGRGRGGRGGSVSGPSDDKGTQASRQRKEANKGSRANHNRRDQRARKMARGGFPG